MDSKDKLVHDLQKHKNLRPDPRFNEKQVWDPLLRFELVRLSLLDLLTKRVREVMARHHYLQNGSNHSTFPYIWTSLDNGGTEEKCSICFEELYNPVMLACKGQHTFCRQCITSWLVKQPSCPLCRYDYIQPFVEYIAPTQKERRELLEVEMPYVVQSIAKRFGNTEVGLEDVYDELFGCMEEAGTVYEEIIRRKFLTRFLVGMKHAASEYEQHADMLLDQLNDDTADIAACSDLELTELLEDDVTELIEIRDEIHERIYVRYLNEDCQYYAYVQDGKPISVSNEEEELDLVP